jgi:hypothetical protein
MSLYNLGLGSRLYGGFDARVLFGALLAGFGCRSFNGAPTLRRRA